MRKRVMVLVIVILLVCTGLWAAVDTRYALVIGNGSYTKTTPLANPANDAIDIAVEFVESIKKSMIRKLLLEHER